MKITLDDEWRSDLESFQDVEDSLPLHHYTHLMHGAQVLAYKSPDKVARLRWWQFYVSCCSYLHTPPESAADMDERLNDFGRLLSKETT